jgi:hypothetical protein
VNDDSEGRPAVPKTKSRIDYRDRNELMMSDLDAREALGDRGSAEQCTIMARRLAVPETKSRTNYKDRNELMISDLDAREALGDRSSTEQRTMMTRRLVVS